MINRFVQSVKVKLSVAAPAAAGFALICTKGFAAVNSIHSVAAGVFAASAQQFKALYKTSAIVSAAQASTVAPRCIHEA